MMRAYLCARLVITFWPAIALIALGAVQVRREQNSGNVIDPRQTAP